MFLNENMYITEMTADPIDCMELYAETVETFSRLQLAQARAEHAAIMNEDNYMLQEALEEAKDKVQQVTADAVARLREFIDKVIEKWTEIQGSIQAHFIKDNKIEKVIKFCNNYKNGKFICSLDSKNITAAFESWNKLRAAVPSLNKIYAKDIEDPASEFDKLYDQFKELNDGANGSEGLNFTIKKDSKTSTLGGSYTTNKYSADDKDTFSKKAGSEVTTANLKIAITFFRGRPQVIKDLKNTKRVVSSFKGRAQADKVKYCQKFLSKFVSAINKITSVFVTVVKDAFKNAKPLRNTKVDNKTSKWIPGTEEKTKDKTSKWNDGTAGSNNNNNNTGPGKPIFNDDEYLEYVMGNRPNI